METQPKTSDAWRYVFSSEVLKRNGLLALVVGCLLTLTNQLDVLLTHPFTPLFAMKIFFNFLIPFVVSSAAAALNRRCPPD
jgi:hypothetical protein